jgi:hypothetical protein
VTTEFTFIASVMGDDEPVGQVDLWSASPSRLGDVTPRPTRSPTPPRPGHRRRPVLRGVGHRGPPGLAANTPYWAIKVDADTIKLAASPPTRWPVAVDITGAGAGVHSLTGGWAVYDAGVLQTAGHHLLGAQRLHLRVAPVLTHAITADFDYLFVCHFLKDMADFRAVRRRPLQLQQVQFRADPP